MMPTWTTNLSKLRVMRGPEQSEGDGVGEPTPTKRSKAALDTKPTSSPSENPSTSSIPSDYSLQRTQILVTGTIEGQLEKTFTSHRDSHGATAAKSFKEGLDLVTLEADLVPTS